MLVIRADAGTDIGSGHLMRCLALGEAWRARGGSVVFLSRCPNPALRRRIEGAGFGFVPLERAHPDPADLQATLRKLQEVSAGQEHPWLVLDGYHFDSAYQQVVREAGYRLLVIDDTAHLEHYHADVLLNQNIGAERLTYRHDPDTVTLLGTKYALLRSEFLTWSAWRREIPDVARKVMVTLGGSDPENVTLKVMRALQLVNVPGLEAIVVVGPQNPYYCDLMATAQESKISMRIVKNPNSMAELMAWADVAVSAAGSTCWELAFMGLPLLAIILARNHEDIANELNRTLGIVSLGWFRRLTEEMIAVRLTQICKDMEWRRYQSSKGRQLVDGMGAERVVTIMKYLWRNRLPEELCLIRRATWHDRFCIWQLRNDPTVRLVSFNREPIPFNDHEEWFASKLQSPYTRIWVLEINGTVVAQVRYELVQPDVLEVNISVAQAFRGKGVGTLLLNKTMGLASAELKGRFLRAVVFRDNQPSQQLFIKAGFRRVSEVHRNGYACLIYEREYSR